MRKICALYDNDERYAYRLMNYINDKRLLPYEIVVFTRKELLEEYVKEEHIELLLIAQKQAESYGISESFENTGKVIILLEDEKGQQAGVYKYQQADTIAAQILNRADSEYSNIRLISDGIKVIGIYSPVGRCFKTTLALAISSYLGHKGKVIYINLEEFCGRPELINDSGGNLSDLIYYFRHNHNRLAGRLADTIIQADGFSYIPVCSSPEDYEEVLPEEWVDFIKYVVERGGYNSVVLDIGNAVRQSWKLLSLCNIIYVPKAEEDSGNNKIIRFREFIERVGKGDIYGRCRVVKVPYDDELKTGNILDKLQISSINEYVGRLLDGE